MPWIDSIYFIALGCLSGFLAGLLGVGGGIVVVPSLFLIFHFLDFPSGELMHVAIGTSLASMIISSISATISQHRKKAILWDLIKTYGPALSVGAIIGAIDRSLSSQPPVSKNLWRIHYSFVRLPVSSQTTYFPFGKSKEIYFNLAWTCDWSPIQFTGS